MSSTTYSDLKRATQSLLDRNIEPSLEAFQHFFPHIIKDQLQYASIRNEVDWWKHKHREGQRQIGVDVALVPFHRPETDKATRKYSRKRAANLNRVSLSPGGNEDISNDHVSGCNDNGKRAVVNAALGSENEREYNIESMATEEKGTVHDIVTIGNTRKMRKISLDSTIEPEEDFEKKSPPRVKKARKNKNKPQIKSSTKGGRWTYDEKKKFLNGFIKTVVQVKTHAQNLFKRYNEVQDLKEFLKKELELIEKEIARRGRASDTQDTSVKKRKGHEAGNNVDADLAQDQGLRKKTKLCIKISKPKPIPFMKANDKEGYMKVKEIIQGMVDEGIQRPASEFYKKYPELTSKYGKSSLSQRIGNIVLEYKTKKAAAAWKEQSMSHPQDEATKRLPIPFIKANDEEGYMKVKEIIEEMVDEGIQHPASKFYEKYPGLTSKYEKSSLSKGISVIVRKAKKDVIPFKKANDEEGYMKVKEIIEEMVDEGIQHPASKFYEKYPELTSKYEKISLSNGISDIVRKAKKNTLLGNEDLKKVASTHQARIRPASESYATKVPDNSGLFHLMEAATALSQLVDSGKDSTGSAATGTAPSSSTLQQNVEMPPQGNVHIAPNGSAPLHKASTPAAKKPTVSESMPPLKQAKKSKKKKKPQDTDIQPNFNLQHVKNYLEDPAVLAQLVGESKLVDANDRQYIPDYIFLSMAQLQSCDVMPVDRIGTYKNRQIGFKGMCCKHCGGEPGFGRYFPETLRSLSQTTTSQTIVKHVAYKCRKTPKEIRNSIRALKELQEQKDELAKQHQRSRFEERPKYGSRKVFFQRLWARLHEEQAISTWACQGNDTIHIELPSKPIPFKKAKAPAKESPSRTSNYCEDSIVVLRSQKSKTARSYFPNSHRLMYHRNLGNSANSVMPIPFTKAKANDEERYMNVNKIIQGMMDEGIQYPASEFYEKYLEVTSKYEKISLSSGIADIVHGYKTKKAVIERKEQSMSHPQDEATKRLSIPFIKANDEEGSMKVKEIIEGMVDEGIQRPASEFYKKYPELTSKYEKSSLSKGIDGIVFMYTAKKDALLGNKDLTSTVQDDAKLATTTTNSPQRLTSTSIAVMNTSDVQVNAKSLRDSTNMEQIFKPIHFKKANDEEGFQKVKEIIYGMIDEGVQDPQNAFFQQYPSLANKYEKGSIRLGVHSFCKNYKIKKANEEKKNHSLLLEQEKQKLITIEAENGLENHSYSQTSMSSSEVEGKIQADDKTKLEGAIDETLQWLVSNVSIEKEEYEKKQKALEAIAAPLFEHLEALETDKCVNNEESNSTHQCTDENVVSEQSKCIEITEFDKFLEEKAISLAEWILVEIIKFDSANVRLKCKEYAEELIKLGFYDREMMKNFCTVEIVDSMDFTSFMKLAHRLSLKKWLLEHGASK